MDVLDNLVIVIISHCMHILNITLYTLSIFQLYLKKLWGKDGNKEIHLWLGSLYLSGILQNVLYLSSHLIFKILLFTIRVQVLEYDNFISGGEEAQNV